MHVASIINTHARDIILYSLYESRKVYDNNFCNLHADFLFNPCVFQDMENEKLVNMLPFNITDESKKYQLLDSLLRITDMGASHVEINKRIKGSFLSMYKDYICVFTDPPGSFFHYEYLTQVFLAKQFFGDTGNHQEIINNSKALLQGYIKIDPLSNLHTLTVSTLQSVVYEARRSNSFSEIFVYPEDKMVVISEIASGIDLLMSGAKVRPETIRHLLVSHLEWIKEKLPDWSGAAFVATALDLLYELLKGAWK